MTEDTTDEQSNEKTPAESLPDEQAGSDDGDDTGDETAHTRDDAPLSDLAERIDTRQSDSQDALDERNELFEEVRVPELERDEVWTGLVDTDGDGDDAVGVGAEAESVDGAAGVTDHIVPKAKFCQRCEYFGAPPTLSCGHDGTTIVEVADSDHFRVRNCPMVEDDD